MPPLESLIEAFKRNHGFSDEAWEIFCETVNRSAEVENTVEQLTKRVKKLEGRRCPDPSHAPGPARPVRRTDDG